MFKKIMLFTLVGTATILPNGLLPNAMPNSQDKQEKFAQESDLEMLISDMRQTQLLLKQQTESAMFFSLCITAALVYIARQAFLLAHKPIRVTNLPVYRNAN